MPCTRVFRNLINMGARTCMGDVQGPNTMLKESVLVKKGWRAPTKIDWSLNVSHFYGIELNMAYIRDDLHQTNNIFSLIW